MATCTHGKNLIGLFMLILIRYAVILKCWKTDVDERLSFKDILEELCSHINIAAEYKNKLLY